MSFGKRTGVPPTKVELSRADTLALRQRTHKPRGRFVRGLITFVRRTLRVLLWLIVISVLWVLLYRFVNPPITSLIIGDQFSGANVQQEWKSLDDISANIAYAAIAAEDSNFCIHHGLDIEAIKQARRANEKGKKLRGGSTISQQVAKNVFLWPQRSYVRKGLEAYFTILIEVFWSKRRIMEVYLNVAEWGPAIYGAESASLYYFDRHALDVSRTQAARLVSILPSPKKWSPTSPSRRVNRKSRNVRRALTTVKNDFSDCLKK
jgi:monofunctional glycosyltransferase